MKVLVLSQYFWPESFRINELAWSMQRAGVDVTVLTGKPNYPEGKVYDGYHATGILQQSVEGITILRVPMIPRYQASPLRLIANYLSFMISAGVLGPFLLFRKHIDIIFIYAPSPLLQALAALPLKWIKGAAMVTWVQDLWPQSLVATGHIRNRIALKIVELLVRFIYRCSDVILIQSEAFREAVSRFADKKKIHYFPNPADGSGKISQESCTVVAEAIPSGVFSIVFAGNLGTAQSLETILEAAVILRERSNICFYVLGDGSRAAWLLEQIEEYKLNNIKLLGWHPVEVMPCIFAKASALLVTLKDEYIFSLTIPSKVQAYLAAGRPIIAALNGEGKRIVCEAEAGVTCPAGDGGALAEAVIRLAGQPDHIRRRMGESGRRYFETHFNLDRLTEDLIILFNKLLRC